MNSSVCDDEAGRIRPAFYIFFGSRPSIWNKRRSIGSTLRDILLRNKPVFPEVPVKSLSDNSVFSVYTINVSGNMTGKKGNDDHENISDYLMS